MVPVTSKNSMAERSTTCTCKLHVLFIVVPTYRRFNCKGEVTVREVDCIAKPAKI